MLDRKLYLPIYLPTSIISQSFYCLQHQRGSSKRVGVTADDWKALEGAVDSRFTAQEQAALAYIERLMRHPQSVNDADFTVLRRHFSDGEIVDPHRLTGLAHLSHRFTDPLGLEVEFREEKVREQTRGVDLSGDGR